MRYIIECLWEVEREIPMRKLWIIVLTFIVFSCQDEEPAFTPTVESLYLNQFKVWSKTDIIVDPSTGKTISKSESRDLNLQYVFTSGTVHVSNNSGESFNSFPDSHIGLDSISYTDPNSGTTVSYYVLDVFRMKNGDPRFKDFTNPRDNTFPELKGYYLFLHLENKNRPEVEDGRLTEILLMYAEGYSDQIQ